jgi:hypothetical protein
LTTIITVIIFLSFQERSSQVSNQRKRTSLVLSKHTKLLEVLELPQLIETCVRNAHYEEALGIQQLAAKLAKPPRGSIPLIEKVLKDIQASSDWMLTQLLGKLRGQITLPECLKVVGFIRRMALFSETELRLKFLQAREQHFDSVLKSGTAQLRQQQELDSVLKSGTAQLRQQQEQQVACDAYTYLCRVTELTRVSIFDTITQYRALFSDDDILLPSAGGSATASSGALAHVSYRQIFSAWIFKRIQTYRRTVETTLGSEDLEEQSLDSLLGQVMYFGQSLGRVGFDFRPQFVPLFTTVVTKKCDRHLKEGLIHFETSLKTFSLPTSDMGGSGGPLIDAGGSVQNNLEAPASLMTHYPIAEISNSVAMTLNELRYCAPVSTAFTTFDRIQELLDAAGEILLLHDRKVVGCESEVKISKSLIRCFCRDLLPYVNRCYRNVFPEKFSAKLDSAASKWKRELVAPRALVEHVERSTTPEPVAVPVAITIAAPKEAEAETVAEVDLTAAAAEKAIKDTDETTVETKQSQHQKEIE